MSVIKFFIYDSNSNWERARLLKSVIEHNNGIVVDWKSNLSIRTEAEVVLYHLSDFGADTRSTLSLCSEAGKIVVAYSAGTVSASKDDGIYNRQFVFVQQLLEWMRPNWTTQSFRNALDSDLLRQQSNVIKTIAILAQFASGKAGHAGQLRRRHQWQTDRDLWKNALKDFSIEEVRERANEKKKSHVVGLIDWINSSSHNNAPDFVEASKEAILLTTTESIRVDENERV